MKNESKIIEKGTFCWACKNPSETFDFNGITTCGECGANKEPKYYVPVVSPQTQVAFAILCILAIVSAVALIGGMLWVVEWFGSI